MDEDLGTERLPEVDRGPDPTVLRRVGGERGIVDVLGADAEHDPLPLVALDGRTVGEELVVEP